MKLKIVVAIAALASSLPASSALPPPPAIASIDWSSFAVALKGVDNATPGIDWTSKTSSVYANSKSSSSQDWATSINATDGVASATAYESLGGGADGSPLHAVFSDVPAELNSSAWLNRSGSFTLRPNTIAVFSVKASTDINMGVPLNGSAYAWAFLNVDGPGVFGANTQHSGVESISWASGFGNPQSDSRTLEATFLNLTAGDLTGTLTAFATVSKNGFIPAIPEPRTYGMMLAGLGLLGFVAWRRKLVAVRA